MKQGIQGPDGRVFTTVEVAAGVAFALYAAVIIAVWAYSLSQ